MDAVDNTAFFFAIPLRAKASSKDWGRVCELLEATVASALNQSDPDFTILIAGHDQPSIDSLRDPRVMFLRAEFPVPQTLEEQMDDKGRKRRMLSAEAGRRGGGYFMLLDSDDLVSRELVRYARQRRNPYGYVIRQGYVYNSVTKGFKKLPEPFDQVCGSCAVFHFSADDLPKQADDPATFLCDRFTMHMKFFAEAAAMGRPLEEIPFPAAVYLVNNGENHSFRAGFASYRTPLNLPQPVMRLLNRLLPGRSMTGDLKREFGFERRRRDRRAATFTTSKHLA